jgi:hypothetical protein
VIRYGRKPSGADMISEEHHALAQALAELDRKLGDFEAGGAIFDAYVRRAGKVIAALEKRGFQIMGKKS